jgi:hypothetical protein
MRITVRNNKNCLMCNRSIMCLEGYKCPYCKNYYHKSCLRDMFFINNNSCRCIICQQFILPQTSLLYDITKCMICEFLPGVLLFSGIIGIFVFFGIDKAN